MLNLICTIFLVASLYCLYEVSLKYEISVGYFSPLDTIITTGHWKPLLFEMFICSLACNPIFNNLTYYELVSTLKYTISHHINDFFLVLMFQRLYLPVRFSFYFSDFMNPRTQRVCSIYGAKFSSFFALKCLVLEKPYPFLLWSLGISIIVLGYSLRMFES